MKNEMTLMRRKRLKINGLGQVMWKIFSDYLTRRERKMNFLCYYSFKLSKRKNFLKKILF
jgi:hypothetical protein